MPGTTTIAQLQSSSAHAPQKIRSKHILFEPSERIFYNGTNPVFLLTEPTQIGKIAAVPGISDKCTDDEIAYEKCYASWSIVIETTSPISSIEEIFVFVDASSKITGTQLCTQGLLHQKDVSDLLQEHNCVDHKLKFEISSALLEKEVSTSPTEAEGSLKYKLANPKPDLKKAAVTFVLSAIN